MISFACCNAGSGSIHAYSVFWRHWSVTLTIYNLMRKQWQLPQIQELTSVQELANELSIHPLLAGMLLDRGIKTAAAAQQFFQPKLSDLHDPFQMKDLAKAVERILQAAEKGDKVLLYGDYDVDGTSSVALMYAFLESLSMDLDYYIRRVTDCRSKGSNMLKRKIVSCSSASTAAFGPRTLWQQPTKPVWMSSFATITFPKEPFPMLWRF